MQPPPASTQPQPNRTLTDYLSLLSSKRSSTQLLNQTDATSHSFSVSAASSQPNLPPPSPALIVSPATSSQPPHQPQSVVSDYAIAELTDNLSKPTHLSVNFSPAPLSRSHRGSVSSPCIPTLTSLSDLESAERISTAIPPSPRTLGSKKSARALISRAVAFGQGKAAASDSHLQASAANSGLPLKKSIASAVAIEVLSLIFRNLMDRKSILNCSLVSMHWHGPARLELARITQDMPFNGQGLVHAIRTRFAADTFPFMSMSLFDKLVCNLSELYYHSNPDTKEAFAPAYAPDMLYHLFWTFLFIDQEFRNPRARPKVTCNYFVRLLQNEGGGYPREFFDKKILKSIYNDIRSRPLLPAPHLIRALQEVEGPSLNASGDVINPSPAQEARPTMHTRQSSFMNLASSIILEEPFKRVRRWWKSAREDGERNQVGWVSHVDPSGVAPTSDDQQDHSEATQFSSPTSSPFTSTWTGDEYQNDSHQHFDTNSSVSTSNVASQRTSHRLPHSSSSTFPQGTSSSIGALRSRYGAKSELTLNRGGMVGGGRTDSHNFTHYVPSPILNQGFTTVAYGWHPDGDGLDNVVRFPKPKRPSSLGAQHHILQYAELILEMEQEL